MNVGERVLVDAARICYMKVEKGYFYQIFPKNAFMDGISPQTVK